MDYYIEMYRASGWAHLGEEANVTRGSVSASGTKRLIIFIYIYIYNSDALQFTSDKVKLGVLSTMTGCQAAKPV